MYNTFPEADAFQQPPTEERVPRSYRKISFALIGVVACVLGIATYKKTSNGASQQTMGMDTQLDAPLSSLNELVDTDEFLMVSNEYERSFNTPLGDGLYPVDHLVEVQKKTLIQLGSGSAVAWDVRKKNHHTVSLAKTESYVRKWEFTFPEAGEYILIGQSSTGDGGYKKTEYPITAKIVRRELRTLSETDRKSYFDALRAFYSISQEDGERIYGSQYLSLTYLVRQHLYGAASISCDHWHDGAGIINHHVGVTWEMENSLRMIDNSTAAHYWDYTIEYKLKINWYESDIFKDDWFGDNSPNNADHVVDKGHFRFTKVMINARNFSEKTNPYGLLRSPWNTNPVPYLMRHNKTIGELADSYTVFPNCSDFAGYISNGSVSLADLNSAVNGQLHGPVHLMIGGHWGINAHKDLWSKIWKKGYTTVGNTLLYSKFLWRQGFITLPEFCSKDAPHKSCMAHCPSLIDGSYTAEEILRLAGFEAVFPHYTLLETDMAEDNVTLKDFLSVLCEVGSPGEMFTSAAPQDPTFWPLHGNAERYVQYIRLLAANGTLSFDDSWGYTHQGAASDTNVVCDWSNVSERSDRPTCSKGECPGHKEFDVLPFVKLFPTQKNKMYTNREFFNLVSPFNTDLPYAYDGLKTWRGCKDDSLAAEAGLT